MKRILCIIAALYALCSCSSKPLVIGVDTTLTFEISDLKGTQLRVTATPEFDMCWFLFDILPVEEFQKKISGATEEAFMQSALDNLGKQYDNISGAYREGGAAYVAGFDDMMLYFGKSSVYYTGLTPETDYYVLGFCVDPMSRKPSGPLQKMKFRTTAISPEPSNMVLDFMVQDGERCLYYYTKPTLDGKLCRDPYLVDFVPQEVIDERAGGDMLKYAAIWYAEKLADGTVSQYLKTDISRNEVYVLGPHDEGKRFVVFGAPYNINNKDKIFTRSFIYYKGISMRNYAHDLRTGEDK